MYEQLVAEIILNVGGKANIKSINHCMTRLRFKVNDDSLVNMDAIKKLDVISVVHSGGQFQVIIGNNVIPVYQEVIKQLGGEDINKNHSNNDKEKKEKILDKFIDIVSAIFQPYLGILAATGSIKGFTIFFVAMGLMQENSGTYNILFTIGDSFFYFMPIFLAYSAAKKFGSNPFIGMAIAASMLHPNLANIISGDSPVLTTLFTGTIIESPIYLEFLNIPVILMKYSSTVIPILFAVYFSSKVEKVLTRIIPQVVLNFFLPLFTLIIVVPITLMIIGPVTVWISDILGQLTMKLYSISPILLGVFIGGFWQILVVAGVHWGLVAVSINNLSTIKFDPITGFMVAASFAQIGAVLAIILKTKNPKLKAIAIPAFITGIFGVTEPAIYGVTLEPKKPFIITCIASAIGGAILGYFGSVAYVNGGIGIFQFPVYIPLSGGFGKGLFGAIMAVVISFTLSLIATYIIYKDNASDAESESKTNTIKNYKASTDKNIINSTNNINSASRQEDSLEEVKEESIKICSPLKGVLNPISSSSDAAFSGELLGKGAMIIPSEGKAYAPCDGTLVSFMDTHHAFAIISDDAVEVLVHIGIDTVSLNGKYFTPKATQDQKVKKGDLIVEFDINGIEKEGYKTETMIVITNSANYKEVALSDNKDIAPGDTIITIKE